jgi:hypothetical protein
MQAGKLRFAVDVEQLVDEGWEPFFSTRLDIQTASEGENRRQYQAAARWRAEWDQIAGLATMNEGFRIVWTYGVKDGDLLVRYLYIDEILDPDNRRREVRLHCHEVIE